MIKDIKYNGYTNRPSDYECPDGDLAASLNLLNEDGNITSIEKPSPVLINNLGLKPVLIHETATPFCHYILTDAANNLYWVDSADINPQTHTAPNDCFKSIECSFADDCRIFKLSVIGNFIVAATSRGIFYILWSPDDSKYLSLGNHLPEINIEFALFSDTPSPQGHTFNFSVQDTDGKYTEALKKMVLGGDSNPRHPWRPSDADTTRAMKDITNSVIGELNKFITGNIADNKFAQPFFVRYAYRLFDGSNALLSPPILMVPYSKAPRIKIISIENKDSSLVCSSAILCTPAELAFRILALDINELKKWKNIITHIDIFATPQLNSFKQDSDITVTHRVSSDESRFSHMGFCTESDTRADDDNTHRRPNSTASPDAAYYQAKSNCEIIESGSSGANFWNLDYKSTKEVEAEIKSSFLFYRIASIDFEEITQMTNFAKIDIDGKILSTITAQKTLEDELYSHDTLVSEYLYPYNARLSIANLSRTPFPGFPIRTMSQYTQTKDAISECSFKKISIYVKIKSSDRHRWILASSSNSETPQLSPYYYDSISANFPRWLFYPDINATEMIVVADGENGYWRIPLSKHDFLNGAYWFRGMGTKTPEMTAGQLPEEVISGISVSAGSGIPMKNRVFNSEVNNPLFFPINGMVTVGVGKIRGICSAARPLSQGQFGQFPLYAFTDDGVWAIAVASDGTYSARQPITRDVILENTDPLQMDSSVLFATDRGLMLIAGSQTQSITDVINSLKPFDIFQLPGMDKLYAMLGSNLTAGLSIVPFSEYIQNCGMLYDYSHQQVIVYNPDYAYAYVYSLKSKEWGMVHSSIEAGMNSYPEAMAVSHDGALMNLSSMNGEKEKGLLVTRPLKLDAPDVLKTVDTIIQRGFFQKGHVQSVLYGSRDLFNWHLVWSSKDHYLRGFRGTPYKYFRIALVCDLSDGESIYGASLQFSPRQTNQPR